MNFFERFWTRLVLVAIGGLILPTAVCGVVQPAVAATAPPINIYPKFITAQSVGGTSTDAGPGSDRVPSQVVVRAGQTVALDAGILNFSHSSQAAVVHFSIDCYASPKEIIVSGPSIALTVPGDPATFTGVSIVARVHGSFTVPTTCNHVSGTTADGALIFTVTSPGTTGSPGSANAYFRLGTTVPGPGFPPVGALGSVVLWRAVDARELSAIQSAGNRYTLGPGQIGKYFYPTQAQAQAIAAKYEGLGYGNYSVTSTTVTDGLLDGGFVDSISIAGEGDAWFFLETAVAEIGEVAIIA